MTHILLHFLIPLLLAKGFYSKNWQKAYMILMATMLVDLDHLLATPIYDAARCSIGFHPLHQWFPICLYILLCFSPYFFRAAVYCGGVKWQARIKVYAQTVQYIGVGLILHMALDSVDCQLNTGVWWHKA